MFYRLEHQLHLVLKILRAHGSFSEGVLQSSELFCGSGHFVIVDPS